MNWSVLLLAAVTVERLAELWLARRNTRALTLRGAFEVAADHYPLIVMLHTLWLVGLWMVAWDVPLQLPWVGVFGFMQVLRFWTMYTIGRRWTTRIIVLPDEELYALLFSIANAIVLTIRIKAENAALSGLPRA